MSLPFETYERQGRRLLGRPSIGNGTSRRGYGLPVFEQCGSSCAYCGYDMSGTYEAWLNLSVDHVVPAGDARRLGLPAEWYEDVTNLVTCCRACNEFLNGYHIREAAPATVDEFFDLRDAHFMGKLESVQARHRIERDWYEKVHPPTPEPPNPRTVGLLSIGNRDI